MWKNSNEFHMLSLKCFFTVGPNCPWYFSILHSDGVSDSSPLSCYRLQLHAHKCLHSRDEDPYVPSARRSVPVRVRQEEPPRGPSLSQHHWCNYTFISDFSVVSCLVPKSSDILFSSSRIWRQTTSPATSEVKLQTTPPIRTATTSPTTLSQTTMGQHTCRSSPRTGAPWRRPAPSTCSKKYLLVGTWLYGGEVGPSVRTFWIPFKKPNIFLGFRKIFFLRILKKITKKH